MKKKTIIWLIVLVAFCSAVSAGIWVYNLEIAKDNNSLFIGETLEVKLDTGGSVGRNTVLTFVSTYEDGFSDTREVIAPVYMYGWQRDRMESAYPSWQMDEFSPLRVVFNRSERGRSSQHYVLGEKDGYVAVYYKDSGVLKEVTSTPVASLNDDERKSVISGKEIDGDTHLYLCLQDLES